MKVTVREKTLADGRKSLFLDVYQGRGQRRKEFLGLYLIGDRKHDREQLRLAELVRTRRQADIDAGRLGVAAKVSVTVAEYLREMAETRNSSRANAYACTVGHAEAAGIGRLPIHTLTVADCDRFRQYLLRLVDTEQLMSASAETYMAVFRVAVRQAYRHGDIVDPLHDRFQGIRGVPRNREFLSLDEVRELFTTPYREPYRSLYIFAILTGLRMKELERLTWGDIEGDVLRYYQPKTRKWGKRRIPAQAIEAIQTIRGHKTQPGNLMDLDERLVRKRARDGYVWPWFPNGVSCNNNLREWLASAGITRRLTMHCLRHTFATLQIDAGTSVLTVSGLLGHSNLKTTQRYVHLLDRAIDDAADRIIL